MEIVEDSILCLIKIMILFFDNLIDKTFLNEITIGHLDIQQCQLITISRIVQSTVVKRQTNR